MLLLKLMLCTAVKLWMLTLTPFLLMAR